MGKRFYCGVDGPVVETKKGKLRGYLYDKVYHFLGIRYAKAKRFHMPEEVDAWEGIKDAGSYGFICPVLSEPIPSGEVICPHRFWLSSEHCQYLNIWTPTIEKGAKKPVMVWFHGGGYTAGSSIEQIAYEGDNLARYEDVILVSVNHRLNAFGYLDLSSFDDEKYHNSVNAGLADLVAALKWVHENIENFGGDPENVTIFGQSGGGSKTTSMGQIKEADGLYHKAIIMSGIMSEVLLRGKFIDQHSLVQEILKQLQIPEIEVERLEKVPVPQFIWAVNRAQRKFEKEGYRVNWTPMKNDWYLGDPIMDDAGFGEYVKSVPTIVGTVISEFGRLDLQRDKKAMTEEERENFVKQFYGEKAGTEMLELYRKAYPGKNEVYACCLDTATRGATVNYAMEKAKVSSAPTYNYLFGLEFNFNGGTPAWHCSDIAFYFHNAERLPICHVDGVMEKLERQMCSAFVNFAKTGDPNHSEIPVWREVTGENAPVMLFDAETELKENFFDKELLEKAETFMPAPAIPHQLPKEEDGEEDDAGRAWLY